MFVIIGAVMAVYFPITLLPQGLSGELSLALRFAALVLFFFILWLFRFFTPAEIAGMKKLFRRSRSDG